MKGPSDALITYEPFNDKFVLEGGTLGVEKPTPFPYFKEKEGKLETPKTSWIDTPIVIRYSLPEKRGG